jgi:hypothetical protein
MRSAPLGEKGKEDRECEVDAGFGFPSDGMLNTSFVFCIHAEQDVGPKQHQTIARAEG